MPYLYHQRTIGINKDAFSAYGPNKDKVTCTYIYRNLIRIQHTLNSPHTTTTSRLLPLLSTYLLIFTMAPKPASTAGKVPVSTASKAPAKSTEGVKATKKTREAAPADGEKKKRRKVRKETYSSYIYKGKFFDI